MALHVITTSRSSSRSRNLFLFAARCCSEVLLSAPTPLNFNMGRGQGKGESKGKLQSDQILEIWVPWLGKDFSADRSIGAWRDLTEAAHNANVHIKLCSRNKGKKLVMVAPEGGPAQLVEWADRIMLLGRSVNLEMQALKEAVAPLRSVPREPAAEGSLRSAAEVSLRPVPREPAAEVSAKAVAKPAATPPLFSVSLDSSSDDEEEQQEDAGRGSGDAEQEPARGSAAEPEPARGYVERVAPYGVTYGRGAYRQIEELSNKRLFASFMVTATGYQREALRDKSGSVEVLRLVDATGPQVFKTNKLPTYYHYY